MSLERTSKFLSLILRHKPEAIGIALDERGWADVGELIRRANANGHRLTRELLDQIVATNSKKRFAFSADGSKIRASQGHSVPVDLELAAIEPPEVLYHGTATRFLDSIRGEGLIPGSRRHVHLSADTATATSVGKRHGRPVVLTIRSGEMARSGYKFFLSENGVWLTAAVPAEFIAF